MAYSKQNFQNGQILNAANLEAMENGIIAGQGAENLLDNSNFTNPINQRGLSSYTGVGYCIDRWKAGTSISKTYINKGKSVAFYPETEGEAAYWRQYINYSTNWLYGKTFTLAIKDVYGNTYVGTGTYPTEAPTSTKSVIWITMNTNRTFVLYCKTSGEAFVQLSTKDKQTVIVWVALYEGAYTADTLPPYIPKDKRIEMLNCGIPVAPHNLLDNSDFRDPVNHQGASEYSGYLSYTIDRWFLPGSNVSVTVQSGSIKATATSGSTLASISQKIASATRYAGKTLTLAAYVQSNVTPRIIAYNGGTSIASKEGTSGSYQLLICNFTVPADITDGALSIRIQSKSTQAGDYVEAQWAALYEGSYTADTLPAYVPKDKHIEMLNCNVPLAPRNLLDNSDFRNPVNQRGATSYISTQHSYTIDRWYMGFWTTSEGTGTTNIEVKSNGIRLYGGVESTSIPNSCNLSQKLDASKMLGKTYTLAVNISSLSGSNTSRLAVSTESSFIKSMDLKTGINILTFTMPSSANTFIAQFGNFASLAGNGKIDILVEWAALYEGAYTIDTLPAYQPKGYAAELAECQRYYQFIPEQTSCSFSTAAQSNKYFASSINFPQMRIAPTVSLKKDSNGYIGVVQGVAFVSASEFDFAYKLNGTLLPATTNANYAGKVMSFYGIELNADL